MTTGMCLCVYVYLCMLYMYMLFICVCFSVYGQCSVTPQGFIIAISLHQYTYIDILYGEGNFHLDAWLLQPSISQCKVS